MENHTIGIVICSHNRSKMLIETLNSILRNKKYPENIFSIHVVLNACSDDSLSLVTKLKNKSNLPIEILIEERPGKSYALNLGIESIKKDYYFFLDDDQILQDDFLFQLSQSITLNKKNDIWCGYLMPSWDGREPRWVHNPEPYKIPIRPFPEYDLGNKEKQVGKDDEIPSGGNIIVHKRVIERIGGFSVALGPTKHNLVGGEDQEFLHRALACGYKIYYNPKMRQLHQLEMERMSYWYMIQKSYRRSYSNTKNKKDAKFEKYMITKVFLHLFKMLTNFKNTVRFYYIIRIAACFGEIRASLAKN